MNAATKTYEAVAARRVAFLGLGVMGGPMAGHLARAGHDVAVYNRTAAKAEAWARERNLAGMWLDTFAFQARPFYEKLGFSVFGTIEDHPRGSRRFFMQKRLD